MNPTILLEVEKTLFLSITR